MKYEDGLKTFLGKGHRNTDIMDMAVKGAPKYKIIL